MEAWTPHTSVASLAQVIVHPIAVTRLEIALLDMAYKVLKRRRIVDDEILQVPDSDLVSFRNARPRSVAFTFRIIAFRGAMTRTIGLWQSTFWGP